MGTRHPDSGTLPPTDFGSTAEEEKHTEVRLLKGRERAIRILGSNPNDHANQHLRTHILPHMHVD